MMDHIQDYLNKAIEYGASSVILAAGKPICYRKDKELFSEVEGKLLPSECETLIKQLYELAGKALKNTAQSIDDEFTVSIRNMARFRVNVLKQRGSLAAVVKFVNFGMEALENLHIPDSIMEMSEYTSGIIIVSGLARSGKSKTITSLVNKINNTKNYNIVTIEDTIEFLHKSNRSVIMQREINTDTDSYVKGIKTAIRQQADVIVVSSFGSLDIMQLAMTAAESGTLVIAEMTATDIQNVIQQINHMFSRQAGMNNSIRLFYDIKAIINQSLVYNEDGNSIPVFDILSMTDPVIEAIKQDDFGKIADIMENSTNDNMITKDKYIKEAIKRGVPIQ